MKVVQAGRLKFPAGSGAARAHASRTHAARALLSLHGRAARLGAAAGIVPFRGVVADEDLSAIFERIAPFARNTSDWLVLEDYQDEERSRTIVFLFRRGEAAPWAAVKIRPRNAGGVPLRKESETIAAIRERLPARMLFQLPQLLGFEEDGEVEILALSALPGIPLSIRMQRSLRPRGSHLRHLASAGEWLGAFHAATRDGESTAVHGDYWPRNLLFTAGGQLGGVVDWEHASLSAPPRDDVFTLPLLFIGEAPSWRGRRDPAVEVARALAGEGTPGRALDAYLEAYSRSSSVPAARLREELALFVERRQRTGALRPAVAGEPT